MLKNIYTYAFFLTSLIFLSSCNNNEDIMVAAGETDIALEDALLASSDNVGKAFYRMPDSDEFSKIPQDPKNPLTAAKVELGKFLFHETGIAQHPTMSAGMNTYSCASCHHAKAGFQACMPQGIGEGGIGFGQVGESRVINPAYLEKDIDTQPIRSPSAMNLAYQTSVLWNGQFGGTHDNIGTEASWTEGTPIATNKLGFQGIETQAIAGRDVHRLMIDRIFMSHVGNYRQMYINAYDENSFNDPLELKNNGALAIAAYERTLLSNQSPFQLWLKGDYNAMLEEEKQGAILFFGKAKCASCHNGPSLANMDFHAIGMKDLAKGNYGNLQVYNVDETNVEHKGRGGFTKKTEDLYKFKVPQLYNLKDSPFYGHGASFTSIRDVIEYKNKAIPENSNVSNAQLDPAFTALNLTSEEIDLITLFLKNGLRDPNLERYSPESLPSGLGFPNNDNQTRIDLGF
ncbi:cytochrome-c peroxidase [Arcticibacterium luteifluviistationis]|uniref:Cytochrome-c peroxidase n=1 Tax=Arcticibacterium luteifluviistationis TaxID=1784714 RepID=A0A2Z4G8N9_9BACT|nr:cytochrome c peroxidase [Arcticibacterium luteifluviistationis]AWV97599.1 cytochrome-c peroxidase [Arcticibacterium luteifluviistationis]